MPSEGASVGVGAVLAVLEAELALVVGSPDVVGALGRALGTAWVSAAEAALGAGKAFSEEDAANGGGRGELPGGVAVVHEGGQLAGGPGGGSLAQTNEGFHDRRVGL